MDDFRNRRQKQEITDREELLAILDKCDIGWLGMSRADEPYVLPVNFTREGEKLYIHCSPTGKKIDFLIANPNVCLTALENPEYIEGRGNYRYRCVICYGKARLVEDREEMLAAYQSLCAKIDPLVMEDINDDCLDRSAIICIEIEKLTGKHGVE
ncbi:MAG: pyridoxamine 5'-phosphate oxidase family protein [bacterium]